MTERTVERKDGSKGDDVTTLYRPVGQAELDKIRATGWRRFPPRLHFQPIFYPVLNEAYAVRIARDWNTTDPASGFAGYVTRFRVRTAYLNRRKVQKLGGPDCFEYWIPAEAVEEFNENIVGGIEVIRDFYGESWKAPSSPA